MSKQEAISNVGFNFLSTGIKKINNMSKATGTNIEKSVTDINSFLTNAGTNRAAQSNAEKIQKKQNR
ncbi:hypothetical protein CMU93_06450 [Elizabethkingia anophelis]|nr:hypothetical protein [Elizabethkingia anophelis]